ncbi:hypothetical protein A2U01_0025110 [Trifolium medium]|uniref:Uncharacterized protein n=1 Tax=Trifolium medium TaxID=97028 RepID=A0A392NW64_9FABA|nr:hypothetical protein [Trifolium medium]
MTAVAGILVGQGHALYEVVGDNDKDEGVMRSGVHMWGIWWGKLKKDNNKRIKADCRNRLRRDVG